MIGTQGRQSRQRTQGRTLVKSPVKCRCSNKKYVAIGFAAGFATTIGLALLADKGMKATGYLIPDGDGGWKINPDYKKA